MALKINFDLIRYKMKTQGYSVDDMAKLLEISTPNLYYLMNKDSVPTYYEKMYTICKLLDLTLEEVTQEANK